jgi:hypothetical protein
MSTSDPHRPGGETDRPDETDPSIEQTTPGAADSPAHEVAPTVESLAPPAPTEPEPAAPAATTPTTTEPTATPVDEPVAGTTGTLPVAARTTPDAPDATGPSLDTGRHAVVRPAPTPPDEPAPDPVVSTTATPAATSTPEPAPAAPEPTTTPTPTPVAPTTAAAAAPADGEDHLFPDPNAPRSTSVGSHILGVLVGLILGPLGAGVLLVGEAQILDAQVDGWDASTEVLGIVLVTLGVLLLGTVLLLGLWTPAVPITGGSVLTLAGIVYLYLPSIAREQTLNVLTSSGWRLTVTQVTVAGTSGMVLATGFLLLLAGLVAATARLRGVHLGEFRERHRV